MAVLNELMQRRIMQSDGLSRLPGELVDNICQNLLPNEIRQLRLTCRDLKEKSYHQFAVSYFGVTRFMLTRESLQRLLDLSKNAAVGPCIKELVLVLVTFPVLRKLNIDTAFLEEQEDGEPKQPDSPRLVFDALQVDVKGRKQSGKAAKMFDTTRRECRRKFERNRHDQFRMRRRGIDMHMLTESLHNLPSLESFTIVNKYDRNDAPLGARHLRMQIGMWPPTVEPPKSYYMVERNAIEKFNWEFICHGMAVVFGALIQSGTKLRGHFSFTGAPYNFRVPKTPSHRKLTKTSTPGTTFAMDQIGSLAPVFAELKKFSILFCKYYWSDLEVDIPLQWLSDIAPMLPAVEVFEYFGSRFTIEAPVFRDAIASKEIFPQLREICIGQTCFAMSEVLKFLLNHISTLEHIKFTDCSLIVQSGNFANLLLALRKFPALRRITLEGLLRNRARLGEHRPPRRDLRGLETAFVYVEGANPRDFQEALDSAVLTIKGDYRAF